MKLGFAVYFMHLIFRVSFTQILFLKWLNSHVQSTGSKLIDQFASLQETTFIEQVVEDESQMEGIPPGCSRIMNWHLHLEAREVSYPRGWLLQKNLDVVISNNS